MSNDEFAELSTNENTKWFCHSCTPPALNLPNINIFPNVHTPHRQWGITPHQEFCEQICQSYENVVQMRGNLFHVTAGATGKLFVEELTFWLKQITVPWYW